LTFKQLELEHAQLILSLQCIWRVGW